MYLLEQRKVRIYVAGTDAADTALLLRQISEAIGASTKPDTLLLEAAARVATGVVLLEAADVKFVRLPDDPDRWRDGAAAIQRGWSCDDDFCGTCDYSGLCDAACTFCDATDEGDDTVTSLDDGGSDAGTCRDVSGDCHRAVTQWGYLCAQDFCESCGVYASWCDRYCGYCAVDDDETEKKKR